MLSAINVDNSDHQGINEWVVYEEKQKRTKTRPRKEIIKSVLTFCWSTLLSKMVKALLALQNSWQLAYKPDNISCFIINLKTKLSSEM